MAWGMFCWIPCPYKEWRAEDRKAQIAMLPLVGACIGVIVTLVWWALYNLGAGQFITGAVLTGTYFLLAGFIHLDGFMDCSDAVIPRHPDMEERKRILKDSTNGACAIACACIMFVIFTGAMIEIAPHFSLKMCFLLIVIFTCSRFMSALEVMLRVPMSTSQYANAGMVDSRSTDKGDEAVISVEKPTPESDNESYEKCMSLGRVKDTIPSFIVLVIILGAAEFIMADGAWWAIIAELYSNIIALVVLVAAAITSDIDRKKLGGMRGDISGHMITISEMFGELVLAAML